MSPIRFSTGIVILLIFSLSVFSCTQRSFERESGAFEAFAEMVQAGLKPIALSHPMSAAELDLFMPEANRLAEKYSVSIFRESELIGTSLFDSSVVEGKEVLIIHDENSMARYQYLKNQVKNLVETGMYSGAKKEEISRAFGRMLGYPDARINDLLGQNSDFRDLEDFGIRGQELIWFYKDLTAAKNFYSQTLGLKLLAEEESSVTFQIAGDSRLVLKSLASSEYSGKEAKSVALALLTDHLPAWYAHLQEQKVAIKYTLKENPEGAHDGFVAVDPEGYLLEFEMFRDHPENEILMPELRAMIPQVTSLGGDLNFYGSVTWLYYEDMLPMEQFVTEQLGLVLSADQGWAKIYRLSDNSYLGLVDEKRGMNTYSEEKLVEVKFDLTEPKAWEAYLEKESGDSTRVSGTFKDLGGYLYQF